jgi:hypothetical protein
VSKLIIPRFIVVSSKMGRPWSAPGAIRRRQPAAIDAALNARVVRPSATRVRGMLHAGTILPGKYSHAYTDFP